MELTTEDWKGIEEVIACLKTIPDWRLSEKLCGVLGHCEGFLSGLVLSRRPAEPVTAADPSPTPIKLCGCGFPIHVGRCQPKSPAEAQGDLVHEMIEAFFRRHWPTWKDSTPEEIAKFRDDMAAALAVAQAHPPAGWVTVERLRDVYLSEFPDRERDRESETIDRVIARLTTSPKPTKKERILEILRKVSAHENGYGHEALKLNSDEIIAELEKSDAE